MYLPPENLDSETNAFKKRMTLAAPVNFSACHTERTERELVSCIDRIKREVADAFTRAFSGGVRL